MSYRKQLLDSVIYELDINKGYNKEKSITVVSKNQKCCKHKQKIYIHSQSGNTFFIKV